MPGDKVKFSTWVAWIGATMAAALTMSAYAFSTFETKVQVRVYMGLMEKRLDSIDRKLDQLILRRK